MRYTEAQHAFMREFVPGHSYKEIRDEFNRRFGAELTTSRVKAYIGNHKLNTGRTGHFQKGHIPPNKGKKVSKEAYEKSKPTMFRKGNIPVNTDPIGTEKLLDDGYIWVKIDNKPGAKKQINWRQKHRLVWEKANGSIPENHIIAFLDGDHRNCNLDNLICVSKQQHLRMNRLGLYHDKPELTKTGALVAEVIVKTSDRQKGYNTGKERETHSPLRYPGEK